MVMLDVSSYVRHNYTMIKGFYNDGTEALFNGFHDRILPTNLTKVARRKLRMLHNAENLQDLRVPPSNHLEKLEGNRKGQHSIRINKKYRVCFTWKNGHAYRVEVCDYHK